MDIFETKYCCTLVSVFVVFLFSESVALVFSVHTCTTYRFLTSGAIPLRPSLSIALQVPEFRNQARIYVLPFV